MGQNDLPSVADRYGLARADRERRWTVIVDVALLVAAGAWFVVLRSDTAQTGLRWALSLVVGAMLVHRVLLVADRRRHRRRRAAVTPSAAPAQVVGVVGGVVGGALGVLTEVAEATVEAVGPTPAVAPAVVTEPGADPTTPVGPAAA